MRRIGVSTDLSSEPGVSSPLRWERLLDEHGVQYVALNAGGENELLDHLCSSGHWEVRWEAGGTVLLARATPQGQAAAGSPAGDSL
jgi:hypothetical protein